MATNIHTPHNSAWIIRSTLIASVPVAIIGIWNLGHQVLVFTKGTQTTFPKHLELLTSLRLEQNSESIFSSFALGLTYFLPLLMVALAVSAFWGSVFSRIRKRPLDPGWILNSWLFVLLLPATVTPVYAAISLSFGLIVGTHIFGGTGRYLINPALLSALFLQVAYPGFMINPLPISNTDIFSSWSTISNAGQIDNTVVFYLLGKEIGLLGTSSTVACIIAGAFLIYRGVISWRITAGAILGLICAALVVNFYTHEITNSIPWYWHIAVGNFAFVLIFLACDPSTAPLTRESRWIFGVVLGVLIVAIRMLDPSHPEGSLYATLLALLLIPLMDYFTVKRHQRLRSL